jgi:hypothetical protein
MKRTILVALSLVVCVFAFGQTVGPTKHKALSLDTSKTEVDIQAEFGTRAAQVQLVNDSDVTLYMETNEAAFTGKEIPVKPGESLKVPIGDGDRERIDTVIAKAASGSSKAARLLVTLWQ